MRLRASFGELLGALSVLIMTNRIPTPIPWLRLGQSIEFRFQGRRLTSPRSRCSLPQLGLGHALPPCHSSRRQLCLEARRHLHSHRSSPSLALSTLANLTSSQSYGWAAGDVSLAAYIQSSLAKLESRDKDVSALGAVMAFVRSLSLLIISSTHTLDPQLYVTYIVLYAILSAVLGQWVDGAIARGSTGRDVLKYVGGTQMTVLSLVVICATFIPKGAFAWNPVLINDDAKLIDDENQSIDEKDMEKERSHEDADDVVQPATVGLPVVLPAA